MPSRTCLLANSVVLTSALFTSAVAGAQTPPEDVSHPHISPTDDASGDLDLQPNPGDSALSQTEKPVRGLVVREVTVATREGEHFRLSPKSWPEYISQDADLAHLRGRASLLIPGVVVLSVATLWLSTAAAVDVDQRLAAQRRAEAGAGGGSRRTATMALFQWGLPASGFIAGAGMTLSALLARSRLRSAQREFFLGPRVSRSQAGLTFGGRF